MKKLKYVKDTFDLSQVERSKIETQLSHLKRWESAIQSQINNLENRLSTGLMLETIFLDDTESVSKEYTDKNDYIKGKNPNGKTVYVKIKNLR